MTAQRFGTAAARPSTLVPLALLSAAWTASLAGVGAAHREHRRPTSRRPCPTAPRVPDRGDRGPGQRAATRPRSPRASPPARPTRSSPTASTTGIPVRRARGLPARRDRHQRRRQVLQHPLAADRRDRPGRVRPRPLRRQHPRPTTASRHARHLRHRARRHATAPRRSPTPTPASTTTTRSLRPRGRPDAVHPLDLVGRRAWTPTATAQRNPQDIDDAALAHRGLPLLRQRRPRPPTPARRAAVYRYNHSQEYVDLVLAIMEAYMDGDFTSVPNSTTSAATFTPDYDADAARRWSPRATAATAAAAAPAAAPPAAAAAPRPAAAAPPTDAPDRHPGRRRHRRRPADGDPADPSDVPVAGPGRRRRASTPPRRWRCCVTEVGNDRRPARQLDGLASTCAGKVHGKTAVAGQLSPDPRHPGRHPRRLLTADVG